MDTFAVDNLPPREQWPDLLEMDYPPQPDGWAFRWEVKPVDDGPKPTNAKLPLPDAVEHAIALTRQFLLTSQTRTGLHYNLTQN